ADPIQPDLSRVDPLQGFKRLFSGRQVIEGIKTAFKTVLILLVSYALLKNEALRSHASIEDSPSALLWRYGQVGKVVFLSLTGVLTVFAAIDYFFQRWEFGKSLRQTKQESKQEHKE